MKTYLLNALIGLDQFANALFGPLFNLAFGVPKGASRFGYPDETISSVLGKLQANQQGNAAARLLMRILNRIDKNHCAKSVEADEGN